METCMTHLQVFKQCTRFVQKELRFHTLREVKVRGQSGSANVNAVCNTFHTRFIQKVFGAPYNMF